RQKGWPNAIGWVFDNWHGDQQTVAETLAPEYLFTNWRTIPDTLHRLWSGPWQWVLYDVTTAEVALNWASKGASFVETWAMTELRKDLAKAAR
ncbi:MAG: hypothetical protein G8345_19885, partial [Magnetococcales bacterium]|nr:hypothetical protein [Magnetococcales bacterium]